jgi:hypothetical protein
MDAKITLKKIYKITYKNNPDIFRNTKEPSSGGEHLCLAKVTCGSMVLVHVNPVSIVGAYISCCVCVCVRVAQRPVHTQQLIYAATILTEFTRTSTIEPHVTLARHRCSPPEDGSFVFRNMSGLFLYVILYVFLM